jgi:SAM-dependent methyltransferase
MRGRPTCPICEAPDAEPWRAPRDVMVWRCVVCRARFVFPQPDADALRERYAREHAAARAGEDAEPILAGELLRRATLLTRLAERGPGALLDVGCGAGDFLEAVTGLGWRAIGSEIAFEGAARVPRGQHCLVGELDSVRERPLFDAVTFWDVLEHLPDPRRALAQARARLRPGGLVAVTMPNLRGAASLCEGAGWPYYDFDRYGHIHHLAPTHIRRLFRATGFEPVYGETRGSVDLRHLPGLRERAAGCGLARWALDKTSGLVARLAEPSGRGNTLLLIARTRCE